MPQPLSIRRFEPNDADAVWDVHEAVLRASPLAFVEEAAVDDILAIESHYFEAGGEFLVGELDGDGATTGIVAIGGYLPVEDDRIEIKRMRVDPEHQRQGYGSEILRELERRAREDGYGMAELETIEPLEAARRFYGDVGYEVIDEWTQETTGVAKYRYRKELSND